MFFLVRRVFFLEKGAEPDEMPNSVVSHLGIHSSCMLKGIYSKTCLKPIKTKIDFKTNLRSMQVKSIAECSKRAFCNTFDLH